ncbi:MAG: MATE family efflux transporter [Lachnospiraceae bacterium]|nr:MATE family efflux transporter [Lachnospiraceae bacterium]
MDQIEAQYKKMTEKPVNRLVLELGLPTTISMLVTSVYNLVDTYFVSDLGTSESGATGIVFSLMAIIQAFGFMFGHGAGSNIGRLLGAHNVKKARQYSATSFYMGLAMGVLITVFGLIFQEGFMVLLGSTDTILPHSVAYSRYILIAAPLMVASCIMNNILRYEGKAAFAMVGLVSGALLNIGGDYIFVRVLSMGCEGAGISTALSQFVSAIILLVPFLRGKVQSRFNPLDFSFTKEVIVSIILVGLPSLVRQGLNSISTTVLNICAKPYGDAAIAAMSITARTVMFMFSVGLGIGQGFQPVCGFNYGAKKYSRVKKAYMFTLIFGTCFLAVFAILGFIFSEEIVTFFRKDPEVIKIGRVALRFQSVSLLFVPITVTANMLFQSVGKSGRATFLATARSGLFFIPMILILSSLFGIKGIESAQAVADILAALISFPIAYKFLKELPQDGVQKEKVI